jgi:hypothetical protein
MSGTSELSLTIVVAVNDEAILARNLARSPVVESGCVPLIALRNQPSAARAYNSGLASAESEYVAFVHQDVYLPRNWRANLEAAVGALNATDPDWAVIGSVGVCQRGKVVGRAWSSGLGRVVGEPVPVPQPVQSIDELAFVVRRNSGCSFDPDLPGFHLYGTDVVQTAKHMGKGAYVADLPVVHNSRPVASLGGAYSRAYRYMQKKWRDRLPIQTLIVPIARSGVPLLRARMRSLWTRRARLSRAAPAVNDPTGIASMLGWD